MFSFGSMNADSDSMLCSYALTPLSMDILEMEVSLAL